MIPSVARPTGGAWYEGSDLAALAEAAGLIEACFYEPGAAQGESRSLRRQAAPARQGAPARDRPAGFPDLDTKSEFLAAMRALGEGGVSEVAFYNWGHIRDANLNWIAEGLATMESAA